MRNLRTRAGGLMMATALVLAACAPDDGAPGNGNGEIEASGTVILSGWEASPEEGELLSQMFDEFHDRYPDIQIDYQPTGDYDTRMIADFGAGTPPDVFYVDSSLAPEWIREGFLLPLDDYIERSGFDTGPFYDQYIDAFRGPDGQIYGLPKDASTLVMFYNVDMLDAAGVEPPSNWDELREAAEALTTNGQIGLCLGPDLARVLAFIYQNGGSIYNDDFTEVTFDSAETREAIEFYVSFIENGTAQTPAQIGAGWCGEAFGNQDVAIAFEGNWLVPFLEGQFPDVNFAMAEPPEGRERATLAFTVSYSIGVDSANPDAAWVLLSYLTGQEGMEIWTSQGLALPSREDVPTPEGRDALVASNEYARPWSFVPRFSDVVDAFNSAITAVVEGTGTIDDVINETVQAAERTTLD
jgi:multiple sugar transport system substrate-binding protein